MITKEQVITALGQLRDPQLDQGLTLHNQIRDILVKDNKVNMTLLLSILSDDIQAAIRNQVEEALKPIGIDDCHIRFRELPKGSDLDEMQQRQQAELKTQQQGMPALLAPDSRTNFIAVASGKGGVGKSTVTVNLAVALARRGKKVGIMDCDIYGFSVPDMMGIEQQPELVDERLVPSSKFGVKVISMGFFVQDNAPVIWRGPMLGKMIKNFFNEVNWGEIEYMLLDLPPGTGDIALDIHQMIPHSKEVIVTTPHATASFVAARAGAMAVHTNHEIIGVVENMSYYECTECGKKDYVFGRGGGAKLAEELHTNLIAQIPLGAPDNHLSEADYAPSVYKEQSPTGQIYLQMADQIVAKFNV
ncbi:MAG: Mrp/NBP35 family ATP-binding protein [Paenibacillaceae bacterium]